MSQETHRVKQPGIVDIPAVPATLHKGKVPALGEAIANVPDKRTPEQARGR